jgi:hypothetical protein
VKLTQEQIREGRNEILAKISANVAEALGEAEGEKQIFDAALAVEKILVTLEQSQYVIILALQNLVDLTIHDTVELIEGEASERIQ